MPPRTPDLCVIGAGPGGYVAAIRAAQLGLKTLIVERAALGGTCLNWGCIPSKALIHAADVFDQIRDAGKMSILADNPRLDVAKLQAWKGGVVRKLTMGISALLKQNGVEVLTGEGTFVSPQALSVKTASGAEEVRATSYLLATGARPVALPAFPFDGKMVFSAKEALELPAIPKHLVILGGGVIGCEIASFYAKFGAKVTILEMMDQLMPGTDPECVAVVDKALRKRGVDVHTGAKALSSNVGKSGVTVETEIDGKRQTLAADGLLVAVGFKPNTEALALDKAGVKTDAKGFVIVEGAGRSSNPAVYAIGDLIGPPFLAHKASAEGLVAAAAIAGKKAAKDFRALPAAIFTDPEIATVGMTEAQASSEGREVRVGLFPFAALGRSASVGRIEGFVKLLSDAKTDLLLGCQIVGPEASNLIAEPALAIEMGATAEDLALTIHAHPTFPEALMEAAEAVHGRAIHAASQAGRTKA
jgi:dihydrolipoamide dehydrogenase